MTYFRLHPYYKEKPREGRMNTNYLPLQLFDYLTFQVLAFVRDAKLMSLRVQQLFLKT